MEMNLKQKLLRIVQEPRFSRRERYIAELSLQRIEELESEENYHWTEQARMALLAEVREGVIGRQAATKIDSFLKRHRII
jgi:hypothetical protein